MKGETLSKSPEKAPSPQSDWDALKQVGNDELLGKFGRHTKEYLSSEFRERERKKEQAYDNLANKFFQGEPAASPELHKAFNDELQKKLKHEKQGIRHAYMEWLLNSDASTNQGEAKTQVRAANQEEVNQPAESRALAHDSTEAISRNKVETIAHDKAETIAHDKAEAVVRDKAEAISHDKAEAIARDKAKAQEKAHRLKTREELAKEIAELESAIAKEKAEYAQITRMPELIAINADFTHDKKELARDYAERELNAELTKSNFFKRLWKGDLFKKYYWKKYEKAIFAGERKVRLNGESLELDEIIEKRSQDAIKRFVMGVLDDPESSRYIHRNIGEGGKDGEKLTEVDQETTEQIKSNIKDIIKSINPGLDSKEFMHEFREKIKQTEAEARDQKESNHNLALYNNYAEVALMAYQLADQNASLDRVMEGFKVYNAEVRNNQRTEAHRTGIDKLIDKVESHKIGQFIPAEVLTAAVGSVYSLTKFGSSAVLGLGAGLGFAGTSAGLRERNRITEDRTRKIRDVTEGLIYNSAEAAKDLKGLKKKAALKRARYEAKIGGTIYDIRPATELIAELDDAIKSNDKDAFMNAIAEARVRIDYSDSEQKDLISYSSADAMGAERLMLDERIIVAEKAVSKYDGIEQQLKAIEGVIERRINEEVEASDQKFQRLRLAQSLKRTGKTIALGTVFALSAQELLAAISPNKVGLLEKAGLYIRPNNQNASETILASLTGGPQTYTHRIDGVIEGTENQYREAGYTIEKTRDAYIENLPPTTESVSIDEVSGIQNSTIDFANNGTAYADGNEFGLRIDSAQGAFVTNVSGTSSLPSGEIIDVAGATRNGNIGLFFKVGNKTFLASPDSIDQSGQAIFGQNGYIQVQDSAGEYLYRMFGDNGERYFDAVHLVTNGGIRADNLQHFNSIATANGDGVVGSILKNVQNFIRHPAIYAATRSSSYQSEVFGSGFVSPMTARTGLGEAIEPSSAQQSEPGSESRNAQ